LGKSLLGNHAPISSGQLQESGGERLPKYPKLNRKSKLNSLFNGRREKK
jgi:hypothetical protein